MDLLGGIFWPTNLHYTIFTQEDPQFVERRVTAKEQRLIQKLFKTFFYFLFFSLYVIAGFDRRLHWSRVPTTFVIVADVAVLFSWRIFFLVFKENSYGSSAVEVTATQKVISSGPYRLVRHPMYSGALLLALFTPIALGSWWGLPSAFLIVVPFVSRLFDEEKFLHQNLPAYDEYCNKVRYRLIPRIW